MSSIKLKTVSVLLCVGNICEDIRMPVKIGQMNGKIFFLL